MPFLYKGNSSHLMAHCQNLHDLMPIQIFMIHRHNDTATDATRPQVFTP
jgi:hypothetical protein